MWGALLAASMAAWLHQLTARTVGQDILAGHGVRGGKAMIATLRWRLIAIPGRLIRHARHLILRLPPGHSLHPAAGTACPRLTCAIRAPLPVPASRLTSPDPQKGTQTANPAPTPGPSACPAPGSPAYQDHLRNQVPAHRAIRGIGSDVLQG